MQSRACAAVPVGRPDTVDPRHDGDDQQTQNVLRGVSIALTAVGAGIGALGLTLWLTAPDEDEVDAAARARARLRLGPTGVAIDGAF